METGADWEGRRCAFEHGDLIVVLYDVPFTQESLSMSVWYGVAASSMLFQ